MHDSVVLGFNVFTFIRIDINNVNANKRIPTEAYARIVGGEEGVYVKAGSDFNITCQVQGHGRAVSFRWYHSTRGGYGGEGQGWV